MGLDTSHNAWHGPYSSFMRFRELLAKQIGFNLREMEGFSDTTHTIHGTKKWADLPADDLHILLDHSDCDGEISASDCLKIAVRLEEVAQYAQETMPNNSEGAEQQSELIEDCLRFAKGCRAAHQANEPLTFG